MSINGFTNTPVHSGSWFGLPDFGLTEMLQGKLTTTPSPTGLTDRVGSPVAMPQTTPNVVNIIPNQPGLTYSGAMQSTQNYENPVPTNTNNGTSGNWKQTSAKGRFNSNGDWISEDTGPQSAPDPNNPNDWQNINKNNAEIQSAYDASMGYFNTAQDTLTKNFGLTQDQINSDYGANTAQLGSDRTQAMGTLDTQERAGQTRKEDALAQARRLYQQLISGTQARFGGTSSAGKYASEIQGAEQQRQMGQVDRQSNEFVQQINTARNNVESQYQTGLLKLKQTMQQSLTSAQSEFNSKIADIASSRAQTEQAKASMRLQALQDLRNKTFAVQQQNTQFEQQLAAMREQSNLQIQNYASQTQQAQNFGQTGLNTFNQSTSGFNPQSTISYNPQNSSNPYVGQTTQQTGTQKNWWEQLLGN